MRMSMRPVRIESKYSHKVIINYRITEKCNYSCPYCFFKSRNSTDLESDYASIQNVFYNLKYVIDYYREQGREVEIFLTGGEPSLYPIDVYERLFDIIDQGMVGKLTLSTNFSAEPKWFLDFSERCRDKTNFEIKAAFHPTEITFEEYYNNVKKVKDAPNRFVAHFTFDDDNFIGMQKINEIKDLGVDLDIVLIHAKAKDVDIIDVIGNDVGTVNVTNEDLLALTSKQKKVAVKSYTVYYSNGKTEDVTKKEVRMMDFSKHPPICYHTDLTIMHDKIGINCEYMRSIGRVDRELWKNIGEKVLSKQEIFDYLKKECALKCDRQKCNVGNNCTPCLLEFPKETLWEKIKNTVKK